jgi:hypothetical protein
MTALLIFLSVGLAALTGHYRNQRDKAREEAKNTNRSYQGHLKNYMEVLGQRDKIDKQ